MQPGPPGLDYCNKNDGQLLSSGLARLICRLLAVQGRLDVQGRDDIYHHTTQRHRRYMEACMVV